MKKIVSKCINNLRYGGIKAEEYREIEDEIHERNCEALNTVAVCLTVMFAALFTASMFSEMMVQNRIIYGVLLLCVVGVYFGSNWVRKRNKRMILPLWYVTMAIMVGYAIILNTFIRQDISATTLCVIMIVAPILLMDKPWRVIIFFVFVMCVFVPIDFHQKSYVLAYTDTVNAMCCAFIGSVIYFSLMRTKLREMMQRRFIEQQRDTDKLTECLTKAAFENKIQKQLDSREMSGVLLVMDVDYFKGINDSYGHVFGDVVLHTMGRNLNGIFPKDALCGRFGGDEFVVWIPGRLCRKQVTDYLKELMEQTYAIHTPDGKRKITLSIGIAGYPENGRGYEELFKNADASLYSAKNMGRDRYVFCPEI